MNRKNLTAAVLAGLAGAAGIVGSAQAVNLNPDGLGQVLIYPYYTVNGGNQTVLSVVNTSEDAKAVKVRFLEGQNSREVLDFNLYMSAFDVWTAAIYDDAGTPTLVTGDTSCTVPYLYEMGPQPFLKWRLTDSIHQEDSKQYGDISRASEGHFEMIEMGMLTNASTYANKDYDPDDKDSKPALNYNSAKAVTHKDGTPANCDQLVEAWTRASDPDDNGYWIPDDTGDEPLIDMSAPSGGLFGGASIVNVAAGMMFSYDAKAINGFAESVEAEDDTSDMLHQEPGTILPSLDSGGVYLATVFLDDGSTLTSSLDRGVDAMSYVFMHDNVMNEYTTEAVVNAGTEWVISFPTKQFYVHQDFLDDIADFRDNGEVDDSATSTLTAPLVPFTSTWTWVDTTYDADDPDVVDKPGYVDYACEIVEYSIYDREEGVPGDAPPGPDRPPVVSPAPPPDKVVPNPSFSLCYETQVIRFGDSTDLADDTEILGAANYTNIDNTVLGFEYGWLNMDLVNFQANSLAAPDARDPLGNLFGLPMTGFAVQAFENGFLGEGASTLANYGGIFQHKGTRSAD